MSRKKRQIIGPANASATRINEYYEDFKFATIGWRTIFQCRGADLLGNFLKEQGLEKVIAADPSADGDCGNLLISRSYEIASLRSQ